MKNQKIQKLTFTAAMLALGTVLSLIKPWTMPYGGSVTIMSMLPIVLVSFRYGIGYGCLISFLYSVIQLGLSLPEVLTWGLTPAVLVGSIFLDYIVPYTLIGLSGVFRRRGMFLQLTGITGALVLRFMSHFISGFILWTNMEQFLLFGKSYVGHPILYSLVYNGTFMLPELLLTLIGAFIVLRIPAVRKFVIGDVRKVQA